ncbi:MAG TPA: HNH endonuclease [Gemmatimonadaceae bacterium]|nr:HNH endonuclease [Gemmatimonadaceae bacterium]
MLRTCETCSATYAAFGRMAGRSKWCSRSCRGLAERTLVGALSPVWRGGRAATLARCKANRLPTFSRLPPGYFRVCPSCRKNCVPKGRVYHDGCRPVTRVRIYCTDCGVERIAHMASDRSLAKRCARCAFKMRTAAGNPNWKGGITSANRRFRASEAYQDWRRAVFERDNYQCVTCGQVGGVLHADHILPFSTHIDLRLALKNGRTLCFSCHSKTPTFLGGARRLQRLIAKTRSVDEAMDALEDALQ